MAVSARRRQWSPLSIVHDLEPCCRRVRPWRCVDGFAHPPAVHATAPARAESKGGCLTVQEGGVAGPGIVGPIGGDSGNRFIGPVNFLCKCRLSQSGNRPSNWMAKRLRACFQFWTGIVHFFAACSTAKYTTFSAERSGENAAVVDGLAESRC